MLFRAAYDALSVLCGDPHFLGGSIGALAVLHTWTRTLEWHPHIHMLVPAGALAADGETWLTPPSPRKEYLVPQAALSAGFRGRLQKLARRAGIELPEVPKEKGGGESRHGRCTQIPRQDVHAFRTPKTCLETEVVSIKLAGFVLAGIQPHTFSQPAKPTFNLCPTLLVRARSYHEQ